MKKILGFILVGFFITTTGAQEFIASDFSIAVENARFIGDDSEEESTRIFNGVSNLYFSSTRKKIKIISIKVGSLLNSEEHKLTSEEFDIIDIFPFEGDLNMFKFKARSVQYKNMSEGVIRFERPNEYGIRRISFFYLVTISSVVDYMRLESYKTIESEEAWAMLEKYKGINFYGSNKVTWDAK